MLLKADRSIGIAKRHKKSPHAPSAILYELLTIPLQQPNQSNPINPSCHVMSCHVMSCHLFPCHGHGHERQLVQQSQSTAALTDVGGDTLERLLSVLRSACGDIPRELVCIRRFYRLLQHAENFVIAGSPGDAVVDCWIQT